MAHLKINRFALFSGRQSYSFTWPKFRCFVFFQTLFWDLLPGRRQQNSIELLVAGQGSSVAAVVLTEHARKIH